MLGQLRAPAGVPWGAGTTAVLKAPTGGRMDVLLCAHIDGDRWLCHSGTLISGRVDLENPFALVDLVEKDVVCDAFDAHEFPRKRITQLFWQTHDSEMQLFSKSYLALPLVI